MEDFDPSLYEAEIKRILDKIYPSCDLLFTGMLISIQKGDARMGQRKLKVTGYPRERERWFFLHVQPGDNGTCMKVKLNIPTDLSVAEVYEQVKTLTVLPKKKQVVAHIPAKPAQTQNLSTEMSDNSAKEFLVEKYTRELKLVDESLIFHESKVEELRAEKLRLEGNLACLAMIH